MSSYLSVDLDYFYDFKTLDKCLDQLGKPVDNIDFTKDHHVLLPRIQKSGARHVINLDTHDDLNLDFKKDNVLHCGNWASYALDKKHIDTYSWYHGDHAVECNFHGGFHAVERHFGKKIERHASPFIPDAKTSLMGVGLCLSPDYIAINRHMVVDRVLHWCLKNEISINNKNPRDIIADKYFLKDITKKGKEISL